MEKNLLQRLRTTHPVTLTVANTVTSGKVADALSTLGASPIMSNAPGEAAELVKLAQAAVINLGTPTVEIEQEFNAVARAANKMNRPLVLDPVACGSTTYRHQLATRLLADYHFTVIRGNAGEIASLAGADWTSHGIDAGSGGGDLVQIAQSCARKYQATVVLSGQHDLITAGQQVYTNDLSSTWLAVNVGSGDILSSVIGAFLGVGAHPLDAGLLACRLLTTAGIRAGHQVKGLGSWQRRFFDELTAIDDRDLIKKD